ncbi:unnamed protein product, partial [Amoebophrya sp. A120]
PETLKSITIVQGLKKKKQDLNDQVQLVLDCTKTLMRNRGYTFPDDFPSLEQQASDWDSLLTVLDRKSLVMEREMPSLRAGIERHEKKITEEVRSCYSDWTKDKPIHVVESCEKALEICSQYALKVEQMQTECSGIGDAIQSVLNRSTANLEKQLQPLAAEIQSLKEVWTQLNSVDQELNSLKEQLWTAVIPKKIRQILDEDLLQDKLKHMPDKIQQYDSYANMVDKIHKLIKLNILLTDLKTDALKERHWDSILTVINLKDKGYTHLTLGDLWEKVDWVNCEKPVREQLQLAQGEMA